MYGTKRRYHIIPLGQDPKNMWDDVKLWIREKFTTPQPTCEPHGRIDPNAAYGSWAPGWYPPAMPAAKNRERCCNSAPGKTEKIPTSVYHTEGGVASAHVQNLPGVRRTP